MSLARFNNLLFLVPMLIVTSVAQLFAADETLGVFEPESSFVTTSHAPRPSSRIAENVTVITAADIERLNAHTLAEVLQTVPGIQLDYLRTPSSFSFFNIQGAINNTVLVLVDGIRQNDFDQNMAIPGLIPVQQIERIEIVKGAASVTWGPALGGVINIITKSPNQEQPISGMVSGSIGSQFTTDSRAELSGTLNSFGYYLTAGNLHSDGLTPNSATNMNNLFGKLSYRLPGKGSATFGLSYLAAKPGLDEATLDNVFYHDNNQYRRTNAYLKLSQPLGENLTLELNSYITNRDDHTKYGGYNESGAIVFFNDWVVRDTSNGGNARLIWGDNLYRLVLGVDYSHIWATNKDLLSSDPPVYDRKWDSWGIYANATYSMGRLTILPGIRYDITGTSSDVTSATLGATYRLAESTLLRAYGAQGYSLPSSRAENNRLQRVKTIQVGIESEAVPYLWLKGTYFYNSLSNSPSLVGIIGSNQNRQGFETEVRTSPLYNFSLAAGYTYLYACNSDTGERLKTNRNQTVPPHTIKVALHYDQRDLGLRGTLIGNYVWWNAQDSWTVDRGMIWDMHLNWRMPPHNGVTPELFFSIHNLFNGVQTTDIDFYKNAPRWFEGGLKVRF